MFGGLFHPLSLHHASYVGMYVLLGGTGIYAPVPEELTLLTAGFLIARGTMSVWVVLPLSILALLVVDSVLYWLARTGAPYAQRLRDRALARGLEHTWFFSPSHPLRMIFFLRFIVGVRLAGPVFAGFNKIPWPKFLLATFANVIIFVPVVLTVGYLFHDSLPHLLHVFRLFHEAILTILALVSIGIAGYALTRFWNRKRS